MKTISTLCACSTVGVTPTGYAFGRPQPPSSAMPTSHKRKAQIDDLEGDDAPPTRASPASQLHSSSPHNQESPHSLGPPSPAQHVSTGTGRIRRKTSAGWEGLKRLSDIRLDNVSTSEHEGSALERVGSVSSGKAWLKRLSRVSTSQNPSPTSSPGPGSPSVTFSHGSTAPMLRHDSIGLRDPPVEPNKLVKRSSSQRTSLRIASTPAPGRNSRVPTLRRPATSHQRSATMNQHIRREGPHDMPPRSAPSQPSPPVFGAHASASLLTNDGIIWRHYFEPRSTALPRQGPVATRNPNSFRPVDAAIRRILPDRRYQPTLLMATSISPSTHEQDGLAGMSISNDEDTFVFNGSRPSTPSGLNVLFASPNREPETPPSRPSESDRAPRRSFSISDMFGSSPTPWSSGSRNSRRNNQGGRISLSAGRRYSSAPFPTPTSHPSVPTRASRDSPRPDIMDGSLFARQTHTSHSTQSASTSSTPFSRNSRVWSEAPVTDAGLGITREQARQTPHFGRPSLATSSAPSPPVVGSASRTHRSSLVAPSERASTLVDSDNEFKGSPIAAEDEMDFQSDTVFDSLRTGATGSSSGGGRGLRIESMFDESPPQKTPSGRLNVVHSVLPVSHARPGSRDITHDIPEESESASTPRKEQSHGQEVRCRSSLVHRPAVTAKSDMSSPSSVIRQPLSLGKLEWDAQGAGKAKVSWSLDDDDEEEDWSRMDEDTDMPNHLSSPQSGKGPHYSTQLPLSAANGTPATTANPTKSDDERRGSRSTGRRGLGALHTRSQSVPVIPDPESHREKGAAASRFGTWGLGSKGASEDWNEDFEFDGIDVDQSADQERGGNQGAELVSSMFVPAAIRDRQAQVIGHLGQVKEFALLVEDLKRLRMVASSKRILSGSSADLWREAEGIIDLATLDDDRQELPPPHSPSSVASGFDTFEEDRASATSLNDRHRRKSVLGLDDDIFGGANVSQGSQDPAIDARSPTSSTSHAPQTSASPRADRQSSSAVARSVVESLHLRSAAADPVASTAASSQPTKMPFDTTTLRDLVAHVSILSQELAEVVRNAESIPSSPSQSPKPSPAPSLGQVLADSAASSPSFGKGRLQRSKTTNGAVNGSRTGKENDMTGHMPMMTAV